MTENSKSKVAVVGLGFGAEFIPLWQKHPHTRCAAVCQRNREKLNAVGDYFGVEKRYTDFKQLLEDREVQVVHINTPIPDHAWMSIAALKAGKHVACTVPMATSIADCRKIVQLVKQTGLTYMMMETVVYSREYLFMKQMLDRGELKTAVRPSESPAGHGWLAQLLARPAADVVCDPLCRPGGGPDWQIRGIRELLRIRHHPPSPH
jgi:predicted dehydrogenase